MTRTYFVIKHKYRESYVLPQRASGMTPMLYLTLGTAKNAMKQRLNRTDDYEIVPVVIKEI